MNVCVVDEDKNKKASVGPWSLYHKPNIKPDMANAHDYLESKSDNNSVTFCYHYNEGGSSKDQYQTVDIFKQQVALASEHFKDKDFQLITFNVPENNKFGSSMKGLGFTLMGDRLGRSNTPIFLYVKTKKE